eukprot:91770_1
MEQLRNQKISSVPDRRPVWLPRYFWQWLHHFPHFHHLHLSHKLPWISDAAYMNSDTQPRFSGVMDMEHNEAFESYDDEYNEYYDEYRDDYNDAQNDYVDWTEYDDDYMNDAIENIAYEFDEDYNTYEYEDEDTQSDSDSDDNSNSGDDEDPQPDSDDNANSDNSAAAMHHAVEHEVNPYWIFELVFLVLCAIGIIWALIWFQQYEWVETLKEFKHKRRFGLNRVHVAFDELDSDDVELSIS